MRINVYSQELTNEVGTVEKVSNTGLTYSAVQLMLHSSPNDANAFAVCLNHAC